MPVSGPFFFSKTFLFGFVCISKFKVLHCWTLTSDHENQRQLINNKFIHLLILIKLIIDFQLQGMLKFAHQSTFKLNRISYLLISSFFQSLLFDTENVAQATCYSFYVHLLLIKVAITKWKWFKIILFLQQHFLKYCQKSPGCPWEVTYGILPFICRFKESYWIVVTDSRACLTS